ncbi:MAG: hypothetical protein IT195_12145 [Microthrixaceae bacterium]|nr:hypothetical protein [Microthrixaceae bacterium]
MPEPERSRAARAASEAALVRVVHHYGGRPEFVVLGGLVPELLCAGSAWRHAGTIDTRAPATPMRGTTSRLEVKWSGTKVELGGIMAAQAGRHLGDQVRAGEDLVAGQEPPVDVEHLGGQVVGLCFGHGERQVRLHGRGRTQVGDQALDGPADCLQLRPAIVEVVRRRRFGASRPAMPGRRCHVAASTVSRSAALSRPL